MMKNFQLSSELALGTLATELKGLKAFEPAAAALARSQAVTDNAANQTARTSQIRQVLPDVQKNLSQQTKDASTYASGHLPNSIDDTALAIGATSAATDLSSTRGFGDNSLVGKGAQSLMSAKERFQVSQYGNQLVDSNAAARSSLELAPTEYINAGQQIKVTPSTDAGNLTAGYSGRADQLSQIPASTALGSSVNQSQFKTNEVLDVSKYNASNVYASQLGKFNYVAGLAQTNADLNTAQTNQNRQDTQTKALQDLFQKGLSQAQTSSTISTLLQAAGVAPSLIKSITSIFGSSGGGGDLVTGNPGGTPTPLSPDGTPDYNSIFASSGSSSGTGSGIWAGIENFASSAFDWASSLFG